MSFNQANKDRMVNLKQPTGHELADLETKASSDRNADEDQEHPSINAEEIIQNVFAPDTDDRICRRRKVNKVIKKQNTSASHHPNTN